MKREPFTIQVLLDIMGDDITKLQIVFYYFGKDKEEALALIQTNIEDCRFHGIKDRDNPLLDFRNMLERSMTDGEREFIKEWIRKNGNDYLAELTLKKFQELLKGK